MCRMRRFLAVLRNFFHSSLPYTFSCHSSTSTFTSSCHLFLGLPLGLVVSKYNTLLGINTHTQYHNSHCNRWRGFFSYNFKISLKVGIHVSCESFTIAQCSNMGKRCSYRTEKFIWAEG
jgi:hypothetical protein